MKGLNLLSLFFLWSLANCSDRKRASLHELLMRNREVASVDSSRPRSDPVENQNRRVLVIGDANEQPNYVFDEIDDFAGSTKSLVPEADIYEPSEDAIRASGNAFVGDDVKDYSDPYNVASAPSYSDPKLLAAVMNQADRANFRYPIRTATKEGSSLSSTAANDRTNHASSQPNKINPYSLFPPDFHEFLNIPLHTNPQGSKPPPPKRPEVYHPKNPVVIGGYASTNINGKLLQTQQEEETVGPVYSKTPKPIRRRITPLRHPSQKIESTGALATKEPENTYRQPPSNIRGRPLLVENKKVDQLRPSRLPYVPKLKEKLIPKPFRTPYRHPTTKRPEYVTEIKGIKEHVTTRVFDQLATPGEDKYSHEDSSHVSKIKPNDRPYGSKLTGIHPTKQENEEKKSSFKPSKPDPFFPLYQPIRTVYPIKKPQTLRQEIPAQINSSPISSLPPVVNTHNRPPSRSPPVIPQTNVNYGSSQSSNPYYNSNNINYQHNAFSVNAPVPNWHTQPQNTPTHLNSHTIRQEQSPIYTPNLSPPTNFNPYINRVVSEPQRPHFEMLPPRNSNRQDILPPPNLPFRPRRRPQRKNGRPLLRKRPSFLESFGFFSPWTLRRRTGETDETEEKSNNIVAKDNKGRYILAHGPLPPNAKKVVVMGPFKKPPRGAPVINHKKVLSLRKKMAIPPHSGLLPPGLYINPAQKMKKRDYPAKVLPKKDREPSFKVIHISEDKHDEKSLVERNEVEGEGDISLNILKQETNLESVTSSPKFKRKVDSVVYGKPLNPLYKSRSSTIKEVASSYNVGIPANQLPLHLQEVSDYDKQRIIAAKFYFPRSPSIKRLGMETHIIPIPVPILTPRGKQILSFQDITIPNAASNRRMPILPPPPRHYNQLARKIHYTLPSTKSNYLTPIVPPSANRFNPNVLRRGFSGVFPRPESFIEPTISKVNYGGWRAVESKDPSKTDITEQLPANENDAKLKLNAQRRPLVEPKERNLVRYSSKLKVELGDREKGFIVESSNRSKH